MGMSEKHIYKVVFVNQDQIYEVYVKTVYQSDLYGFVVVEDFVFGEKSAIVIDPSEEKLRVEFEGVERSFIPMHEIIRIDQVKKRGTAKILSCSQQGGVPGKVSSLYVPDKK
ncbi:MAG: DUF1820 family protein [Gammaproteobacteria bacterium]